MHLLKALLSRSDSVYGRPSQQRSALVLDVVALVDASD